MISPREALDQVLHTTPVLGAERVALLDALGRVAAEGVVSPRNVPGAPYSAMDGFAVRHADLAAAPARLRVVGVQPAGTVLATRVEAGTALKIFTGSTIPDGADAVVPIEHVEEREDTILVRQPCAPGANIRDAGEDIRAGAVVVEEGRPIGAPEVGVLASVGRATLLVHARPRVAVLSTGNELVDVGETPARGQVVDTNAYVLAAAVREAGGEAFVLPIARDRPEEIQARLVEAARADVILSSGGVSVGDLDFVKGALDAVRVERLFWRVAQRPGRPLTFGRLGTRLFFGLPGNPVSALVCFALYARPALRRMQGHRRVHLPVVRAVLATPLKKAPGLTEFARVALRDGADGLVATPAASQSSGALSALASGAGLLVGPPELAELPAGRAYPVVLPTDAAPPSETPAF